MRMTLFAFLAALVAILFITINGILAAGQPRYSAPAPSFCVVGNYFPPQP